eukprot:5765083-Pyramimonas_sp.AAC.1
MRPAWRPLASSPPSGIGGGAAVRDKRGAPPGAPKARRQETQQGRQAREGDSSQGQGTPRTTATRTQADAEQHAEGTHDRGHLARHVHLPEEPQAGVQDAGGAGALRPARRR